MRQAIGDRIEELGENDGNWMLILKGKASCESRDGTKGG